MRKLILLLLLGITMLGNAQVISRENPLNFKVKIWVDKTTNEMYDNSVIDSWKNTYQIMMYKDSIVGKDTAYLFFEKKLFSDVKKEEEDWRNGIIGKKIADFEFKDLNGKLISNSFIENKYVIADFSSFFCGPCLREIGALIQLSDTLKGKDVEIIAFFNEDTLEMNQMFSNPVVVENLFGGKEVAVSYTLLLNSKSIIESYKIRAFPTHMIIDNKGVIRNVMVGVPHNEETNEITVVETMLKELNEIGFSSEMR